MIIMTMTLINFVVAGAAAADVGDDYYNNDAAASIDSLNGAKYRD